MPNPEKRDTLHHIAIEVHNVRKSCAWYQAHFNCTVDYLDDTWALLGFENIKLALVTPSEHPAHIAVLRDEKAIEGKLKTHRDGTQSTYICDPDGNAIEFLASFPK